jgi:NMD protein affecting ribosome stability and mRNA decay
MHEGYFQGILQLRDVEQDLIDHVLKSFKRDKIGIAKTKTLKTGFDIWSASNKYSQKIARKLQKEFGGTINASPSLYGVDHGTGKKIYRLNVLYRASAYKKGEVVLKENKLFLIKSWEKDLLVGKNLENGKNYRFKEQDLEKMEVQKTVVINLKPNLKVLHPETNQAEGVENPQKIKEGSEVDVVIYNDRLYLV